MARDTIRSVEKAVFLAFNGSVPVVLVLRPGNCHKYIFGEFGSATELPKDQAVK
jgi:hypothetical protein